MLDQCKACGWSIIHWRVFDAGRATYRSKLLKPMGRGETDSFWTPQSEEDRKLWEKYTAGMTPEKRGGDRAADERARLFDLRHARGRSRVRPQDRAEDLRVGEHQ
jgi:hypothetical protein